MFEKNCNWKLCTEWNVDERSAHAWQDVVMCESECAQGKRSRIGNAFDDKSNFMECGYKDLS